MEFILKLRYILSINKMRALSLFLLLLAVPLYSYEAPDWFIPLREAIYEQNLSAGEIVPLYHTIKTQAEKSLSGAARYITLSRCEYMIGRAYQFEEKSELAIQHYDAGMNWAEKAVAEEESAAAWQMLAENLSQSCAVRPPSYALAHGLKVEKYSKNALAFNKRNAAAQFMIAARWVYAPAPFHNYKKGIEMMEAIIKEADVQKDDEFNIYSSIGYAYIQQKKYSEAKYWLHKSLDLYPSNKYVQKLLNGI
jgi:tetratricopeptide (TPR) repeat protein